MSASLVGSEMCIRDSSCASARCFSSPRRRFTKSTRSVKVWSSSLSSNARRKSSGSSWSRAQFRASSSSG
eukprot:8228535-Alexandrium_andersonii.AAC.1